MSDAALIWSGDALAADLALSDGALLTDDGLRTAIIISLFTDARAKPDADLPQPGADRRGWWGDALADDGREIGSLLWLFGRSKALPEVVEGVRAAAAAALAWLAEDGIASAVRVTAERQTHAATDVLALSINIDRPSGPMRLRFDLVWTATGLTYQGARA